MSLRLYSNLACLFEYPTPYYRTQAEDCFKQLQQHVPEAALILEPFIEYVRQSSYEDLEESFSYTFDLNPVCTLEIGWHLFGEDYRRGQFMAKMRREMAQEGIEESHELPDHLTHTLVLLDAMDPKNEAFFAEACVIPAMKKMLDGFEGKESEYKSLVECALYLVTVHQEQNCRQAT